MLSQNFSPQNFSLKFSRQYFYLTLTIALATLTIFLFLPLNRWIKTGGGLLLLAWLAKLLVNLVSPTIRLLQYTEGEWQIVRGGQSIPVTLLGDSTITTFISILRFREKGRFLAHSCVIFPDSLKEDQYRRLLVVLKMS